MQIPVAKVSVTSLQAGSVIVGLKISSDNQTEVDLLASKYIEMAKSQSQSLLGNEAEMKHPWFTQIQDCTRVYDFNHQDRLMLDLSAHLGLPSSSLVQKSVENGGSRSIIVTTEILQPSKANTDAHDALCSCVTALAGTTLGGLQCLRAEVEGHNTHAPDDDTFEVQIEEGNKEFQVHVEMPDAVHPTERTDAVKNAKTGRAMTLVTPFVL